MITPEQEIALLRRRIDDLSKLSKLQNILHTLKNQKVAHKFEFETEYYSRGNWFELSLSVKNQIRNLVIKDLAIEINRLKKELRLD